MRGAIVHHFEEDEPMSTRLSLTVVASIVLGCLILGLFFGQPATGQQAPAAAPLVKWEYKVFYGDPIGQPVGSIIDPSKTEEEFNKLGLEGWEYAGSIAQPFTENNRGVAKIAARVVHTFRRVKR
jgi:hypothetical protein